MSYRSRLLLVFSLSIAFAVLAAVAGLSELTMRAFEDRDRQRVATLVRQFRRDFNQRATEVTRRLTRLTESEAVQRIAIDLAGPDADVSLHVSEAESLANGQGLDLLTIVSSNGSIVSSAQWSARFGYKEDWLLEPVDWNHRAAFLRRESLPEEVVLAVVAVRTVTAGDKPMYLAGGQKLDKEFLDGIVLPDGMRALLAQSQPGGYSIISTGAVMDRPDKLNAMLDEVRRSRHEVSAVIEWTGSPADSEAFTAIPLEGRDGSLMAVLLAGSSRREAVSLVRQVRWLGFGAAGVGVLLGLALAWWVSLRVTKPVNELAAAAQQVALGDWSSQVPVRTRDELGLLAGAFNKMTAQLSEQRERLVQAERVAAWRELARRLAHELKNPLFPLQITIENLQRARSLAPDQFDEVFHESTTTLLAEVSNLKGIIGRFSDFSKMPKPEPQPVSVNQIVEDAVKLYRGQLAQASVAMQLELATDLPEVALDVEQFRRVLQNLFLNAIDAMPQGGTLTVKTARSDSHVRISVADTGQGLTREECERLFTPYYTTKHHGTGLGLAIVQSVVSDHRGTIRVASEPGRGAAFIIELPLET